MSPRAGGRSPLIGRKVTGRIAGARSSRGRRRGRPSPKWKAIASSRALPRFEATIVSAPSARKRRPWTEVSIAAARRWSIRAGIGPPSRTSVACVGSVAATVAGSGAKASTISATRSRTRRDIVLGAFAGISSVESAAAVQT